MKRVRKESPRISAIALAVAFAVTATASLAQGNKPPSSESAVNNLSYPAVEINNAGPEVATFYWKPAVNPVLGQDFSWGCPVPVDRFPNTSCVNSTGTLYYTPAVCIEPGMPCAGQTLGAIEPIFWQKTTTNDWSAVTSTWTTTSVGPMAATHVDWADNLETQTWWDTASIRVETTPFGTVTPTQTGVEMWHVYGQGQTELWGAHADVSSAAYTYESPYPILHTLDARLNISKISGPVEDCANSQPSGAGAWQFDYIDTRYEWNSAQLTLYDVPYTAELNIGGKYVYGFNWQLRRDSVPASISKTGWWRLTFYTKKTPSDYVIIDFPSGASTFIDPPNGTPPADAKYRPVVSQADALSYIDICVSSSKGGGGKKGPK